MNVDIIVPVHEPDLPLLDQVLYALQCQKNTIKNHEIEIKILIEKEKEPKRILNRIAKYDCEIVDAEDGEWNKVFQGVNDSTADAVTICHADDIWLDNKIQTQLKYINSASLVLTSFIHFHYNYHHKIMDYTQNMRKTCHIAIPQIDNEIGLWNCMPSTWMVNKHKVKKLVDPYTRTIACFDQAVAMSLKQYGDIHVIQTPYVIYSDHNNNQWYSLEKEKTREQLKQYYQSQIKPLKLLYHWD